MYGTGNPKLSVKTQLNKKKSLLFPKQGGMFEDESIEFNDLDSNILKRNLIKFLPTDSLRLELQLERAEKRLKKIDKEIKTSKILEIEEDPKDELLKKKKEQLEKDIESYKSQYRELGFAYAVADSISDAGIKISDLINGFKHYMASHTLFKKLFEKIPGYKEKQKLEKLNMLQEKISGEIKNSKPDLKKLEHLFLKKEELK